MTLLLKPATEQERVREGGGSSTCKFTVKYMTELGMKGDREFTNRLITLTIS